MKHMIRTFRHVYSGVFLGVSLISGGLLLADHLWGIDQVWAAPLLVSSDSFEDRTVGSMNGQGGWVAAMNGTGVWEINATSNGQTLIQKSTQSKVLSSMLTNTTFGIYDDVRLSANIMTTSNVSSNPQLWLRRTSTDSTGNGYLLAGPSGNVRLYRMQNGVLTELVQKKVSWPLLTWTAIEFEAIDTSTHVLLRAYIYPKGETRPAAPSLEARDTTFASRSGLIALGAHGGTAEYDDVSVYNLDDESLPPLPPTEPTDLSVSAQPDTVTLTWNKPRTSPGSLVDTYNVAYRQSPTVLFRDVFTLSDSLQTLANRGWVRASDSPTGNWQVSLTSGASALGTRDTTANVNTGVLTYSGVRTGRENVRLTVDARLNTAQQGSSPQVWLNRASPEGVTSGYLISGPYNALRVFRVEHGQYTQLAQTNTSVVGTEWNTIEVEFIREGSQATLRAYVYAKGTPRPTNPTVTAIDRSPLREGGVIGLGAHGSIVSYNNIELSSNPSLNTVWQMVHRTNNSSLTETIRNLSPETTYDVQVYAKNASGISLSPGVAYGIQTETEPVQPWHHIISTGQSLSRGSLGTPPLTIAQPFQNVMTTGVAATFIPLVEGTNVTSYVGTLVETPISAAANTLTALSSRQQYQSIATLHGAGGMAYSQLRQGSPLYVSMFVTIRRAMNTALGTGRPYEVSAVTNTHGESDEVNGTFASYQSYLEAWQRDIETDVKALTRQTTDVPMFIDQMSSHTGYGFSHPRIALAQLAAVRANPQKIFMVTPKYLFTYADSAHMTNVSYRWLGEYQGKVMKRVLLDKEQWLPVMPTRITRQGNIITADFHVPNPPLVFDTQLVPLKANYGFEYYNSGTNTITIATTTLLDADTVQITLSGTPTSGREELRYAYSGTPNSWPGVGRPNSARGNVRDSDLTPSLYGNTLYNWAVHFADPITLVP
jgi:hypothetical protein